METDPLERAESAAEAHDSLDELRSALQMKQQLQLKYIKAESGLRDLLDLMIEQDDKPPREYYKEDFGNQGARENKRRPINNWMVPTFHQTTGTMIITLILEIVYFVPKQTMDP
ncbi:hypothetical protein CHUAL_009821 [Chamberlinius hualienensis]